MGGAQARRRTEMKNEVSIVTKPEGKGYQIMWGDYVIANARSDENAKEYAALLEEYASMQTKTLRKRWDTRKVQNDPALRVIVKSLLAAKVDAAKKKKAPVQKEQPKADDPTTKRMKGLEIEEPKAEAKPKAEPKKRKTSKRAAALEIPAEEQAPEEPAAAPKKKGRPRLGLEEIAERKRARKVASLVADLPKGWEDVHSPTEPTNAISLQTFQEDVLQPIADQFEDFEVKRCDVRLSEDGGLGDGTRLSYNGLTQIAHRAGWKHTTIDDLIENGYPLVAKDIVNSELEKKFPEGCEQTFFQRTWVPPNESRRETRALLTERYEALDNVEVLAHLRDVLKEVPGGDGALVVRYHLSDHLLSADIILPGYTVAGPDGDSSYGLGFRYTNSEVGRGSNRLRPYAMRFYCANGMITRAYTDLQAASRHNAGEVAAFKRQLAKVIAASVKASQAMVERLLAIRSIHCAQPVKVMQAVARGANVPRNLARIAWQAWQVEKDDSAAGIWNAFTRAIQTQDQGKEYVTAIEERLSNLLEGRSTHDTVDRWESIIDQADASDEERAKVYLLA